MGVAIPRLIFLVSVRKQLEQALLNKSVSSSPSCALHRFRVRGTCSIWILALSTLMRNSAVFRFMPSCCLQCLQRYYSTLALLVEGRLFLSAFWTLRAFTVTHRFNLIAYVLSLLGHFQISPLSYFWLCHSVINCWLFPSYYKFRISIIYSLKHDPVKEINNTTIWDCRLLGHFFIQSHHSPYCDEVSLTEPCLIL